MNLCKMASDIVSNLVDRNWEVLNHRLERLRRDRAADYFQAPTADNAERLLEVHGAIRTAEAATACCKRCRSEHLPGLSRTVEKMESGTRVVRFALIFGRPS